MLFQGFWGQFNGTVDDKGRIMLPQKMRDKITSEKMILTKGSEDCLWLYEYDKFEEVVGQMLSAETLNQVDRDGILRRVVAPATEVQVDKTGRIKIPSALMKQMGLVKNCYVLGMGSRIEIWDETLFEKHESEHQAGVKDGLDELRKSEGVVL